MKNLLIFLILAPMITWFMFSPIYKHVLISRHTLMMTEVDYLLEVGGRLGYVSAAMMEDSKTKLSNYGLIKNKITISVASNSGLPATDPMNPLLRGETLTVEVSYPYEDLFKIDRLLNITIPNDTERMIVKGSQMSEKWY